MDCIKDRIGYSTVNPLDDNSNGMIKFKWNQSDVLRLRQWFEGLLRCFALGNLRLLKARWLCSGLYDQRASFDSPELPDFRK